MELRQDIWAKFGLRGNPFETQALSLAKHSNLTVMNAFVGRNEARRDAIHY